jgi:ligand-binding sensor domain-containing protein
VNLRNLSFLVAAIALAVAAYAVGRLQDKVIVSAPPPTPPSASQGNQAATPAPADHAAPHALGTASAPHAMPGDYVQFAIGNANVKALLADGTDTWIGSSRGVIRYRNDTGEHTIFDNTGALLSNGVFHLSKVRGELWVGTYGGGLSVFNPQSATWRNYNVPNGMADAFIYDTLVTRTGDVWLATWSGANCVRNGDLDHATSWETYTVAKTGGGLPNDWVYGLAEGKNGEIWFGTEGGLARYVDGTWTNWSHKDGLGASYEQVKAEIPFRNDPGQASSHHAMQKKEQGLGDVDIAYNPNYIISLAVDDDGRVWAGTWGGGLSVFDGASFATYTMKDGLPANHVFMLRKDPKGGLWVGTSQGLAKFDGKSFERFGVADGLYSDNVFSMAIAEGGDVWVGSFGGITQFPGGLRKKRAM